MSLAKTLRKSRTALGYGLLLLFFAAPVLRLIFLSFMTPDGLGTGNYAALLREKWTLDTITNTLQIGVGSAAFSTVLGTVLGFLMAYTDLRHKRLLELLILLPFIIPSYIISLSWSGLLLPDGHINHWLAALGLPAVNLYSKAGIVFVLGLVNMPVVYLNLVHFLRKIPKDLDWASRSCGFSAWETLWRIDLKEALPAICAGALLAFLASINNFAVPAFLGISANITVLSTLIYEKTIGFGPTAFSSAAALSVILSALALGGTFLESSLHTEKSTLESIRETTEPRVTLQPLRRDLTEKVLILVLGAIDLVPLADMMVNACLKTYGLPATRGNFSWDNFQFVFTNTGVLDAITNSLFLAGITGLLCLVLGTAIAYWKLRLHSEVAALAERCAALLYALPGIVLALAEIFHWTEPLPHVRPEIYGTLGLLVIAYVTRYLVLQIKGSRNALLSINPELEDAVRACGRGKGTLWKEVLLPLLIKPCLASTGLIFVSALTEVTLSSLLASAGTRTIGLAIFNFQQSGDYNLAAALSTLVVLLILGGYGVAQLSLSNKKGSTIHGFVTGTDQSMVRQNTSFE